MLRHPSEIQARVSHKTAAITAALLLLTSAAQYRFDDSHPKRINSATAAASNPSGSATPEALGLVAEDLPEAPLQGGKISLLIFRIN